MDWFDSALVLHVRPHGESNAVLEAFTREHGRHSGLVRGGRSRKIRPALQTGNLLKVEWRARLTEHLGCFTLELDRPYAAVAVLMLDHLDERPLWTSLMVRWELRLLAELGYGLELERCAATGAREGLIYVSPKSGSAVSAGAGEPYKDKLLPLPAFLRSERTGFPDAGEIAQGFELTGHFLERYTHEQRNLPLPQARQDFVRLLERSTA
jgi:DNA repair protein RecO (recombination protein O)